MFSTRSAIPRVERRIPRRREARLGIKLGISSKAHIGCTTSRSREWQASGAPMYLRYVAQSKDQNSHVTENPSQFQPLYLGTEYLTLYMSQSGLCPGLYSLRGPLIYITFVSLSACLSSLAVVDVALASNFTSDTSTRNTTAASRRKKPIKHLILRIFSF